MTTLDPDQKVAAAEQALAKAQKVAKEWHETAGILGETRAFAVELHHILCNINHEDRCGWYYYDVKKEKTWVDDYTHKNYETKAKAILEVTDRETALAILNIV